LGDPDIIALGGKLNEGGVWNFTRLPFFAAYLGWLYPPPPEKGDCMGIKKGITLKAVTFPCIDAARIICN
jgi:hypothetical protein